MPTKEEDDRTNEEAHRAAVEELSTTADHEAADEAALKEQRLVVLEQVGILRNEEETHDAHTKNQSQPSLNVGVGAQDRLPPQSITIGTGAEVTNRNPSESGLDIAPPRLGRSNDVRIARRPGAYHDAPGAEPTRVDTSNTEVVHEQDDDEEEEEEEEEEEGTPPEELLAVANRVVEESVVTQQANPMDLERASQRDRKWQRLRQCCIFLAIVIVLAVLAIATGVVLGNRGSSNANANEEPSFSSTESPTPAPTTFLEGLPEETQVALEDPRTSQSQAYEWLLGGNSSNSPFSEWRKLQWLALATFFFSTGGDGWSDNRGGWLDEDLHECYWSQSVVSGTALQNITTNDWNCDDNGRIQRMLFNNNNLKGTLPVEISLLTSLQDMEFVFSFQLTGSLPTEIGLLTKLRRLHMVALGTDGPVPSEIGLLQNLEQITIAFTAITGDVPTELGNLHANLTSLVVSENPGVRLPSELLSLTNLSDLHVQLYDDIGIQLVDIFRSLQKLESTSFRQPGLNGTLPSESYTCRLWGNFFYKSQLTHLSFCS